MNTKCTLASNHKDKTLRKQLNNNHLQKLVSYLQLHSHAYSYSHITLVHLIYSLSTYSHRPIFYPGIFLADLTPIPHCRFYTKSRFSDRLGDTISTLQSDQSID